jgi:hypothetical protein
VTNVSGLKKYQKSKNDRLDAHELAWLLRAGVLRPVYHHTRKDHQALMQVTRCYEQIRQDSVRTKNRIKSVFRSVGVPCEGPSVYSAQSRAKWLRKLAAGGHRSRAELLLKELDALLALKAKAADRLKDRARKRKREYGIVLSLPGIGPLRAARLMGHIGTPGRITSKRGLWRMSGLAVVTRSSGDFQIDPTTGEIYTHQCIQTRGLNRDFNRALKSIFKAAALVAIRSGVFKDHYDRRVQAGMRPEMARLTIARKISAAFLACWQKGEKFDPNKLRAPAH